MIRIGSIVLRVDDLQRQTEFWEAALGYVRRDSGESDDFVLLGPPDGAPEVWSVYGAERSQPVAIGGRWMTSKAAQTHENRCRGLPPVALTPKW
jgi:catechol-2,3-dioxygenase